MQAVCSKRRVIIISILSIIGLIIICAAGFATYADYLASQEFPQEKKIVTPKQPNGQKMLIVYQPSALTDAPENIVYKIAEGASEKGVEVTLIRPSKDANIDINSFDIIVFGTPWYMQPSKKLIEYIQGLNGLTNKKIHLYITQGGDYSAPQRFKIIEQYIKDGTIVSKQQFVNEQIEKALEFGREIAVK